MSDTDPWPPPGVRQVWVEAGPEWRVATMAEYATRKCRHSTTRKCPNRPTMALDRRRSTGTDYVTSWWFYCDAHAYGRRIEDGRVLEPRLERVDDDA